MTEASFGNTFHPGANVSLSFIPTGTVGLYQDINSSSLIYASDDEGAREFATYNGVSLKTYDVILTGTAQIQLTSTTASAPADKYSGIALKKESDTLYYVYYLSYYSKYTPQKRLRIRRISITVGVGGTDEILYEVPIDATYFDGITTKRVGNVAYIGLARGTPLGDHNCYSSSISIYGINMDTGAVGIAATWDSGGSSSYPHYVYMDSIPLTMAQGEEGFIWTTCYTTYDTSGNVYVVINGQATKIYSTLLGGIDVVYIGGCNYNSRDYILEWSFFGGSPNMDVATYTPRAGTTLYFSSYVPTIWLTPLVFTSENVFPALVLVEGTDYWWVNPATGLLTEKLAIAGVNDYDIYTVFPTIDTIDGSIYVSVKINGVHKVVGIRANTGEVIHEIDVSCDVNSLSSGFNHGNFLFNYYSTTLTAHFVKYLTENLEQHIPNVVQMIPEMS